ncbi:pre-rRNA 2'-O-ribose RNA methyltransferase FTSJ3-like [Argonauta hians]
MGKKAKVGKARKDRFYQLAKETGYRARSAFKLIQLNRKFEFLQKSRVVVDLCAAPGGWLQVCVENTPVSAIVLGVDLVPIRPIHRVTCLQNDITTESCRVAIKKELQEWKADTVLNDGAPNVGKSWVHDAFQQAQLTLAALRLAAGILRKGGWFVTKIFRSKDYNSLLWVFKQLFKKVHATKPQASRNESAEIFVVCESYLAPDKLDSKFFDPKHVFKEVEETKVLLNTFKPEQKQRNREGYADGLTNLYFAKNVSEFISSRDYLKVLASSTELVFDDQSILEDPLTTEEIKICCKDIRVLGKKDIKRLIGWRKQIVKKREGETPQVVEEEKVDSDEDEELKLQELLTSAKEEERKTLKKRLKKIREQKLKLTQRMDMKMEFPDDEIEQVDDIGLFQLQKIKSEKGLEKIQKGDLNLEEELDDDDDDLFIPKKTRTASYNRDANDREDYDYNIDSDDGEEPKGDDDDDDDISMAEFSEEDDDDLKEYSKEKKKIEDEIKEAEDENPLLVSLTKKKTISEKVAEWFSKDSFSILNSKEKEGNEEDSDDDNDNNGTNQVDIGMSGKSKAKNKKKMEDLIELPKNNLVGRLGRFDSDDSDDDIANINNVHDDDDDDDTDSDENEENVIPQKAPKRAAPQLDPEGLALAAKMIHSKKQRREVIESGYHKFMYDDTNLPRWFLKEEEKHARKNVPVTKAEVEEYKKQMKEVDARPIKKVAEAKIRKKIRMTKKLQKVRKKAESVTDCVDTSEREKWLKIKEIYKKAGLLTKKKKEVSYVISKKGGGTKGSKPKGPYKVVDRRLKKDKRPIKAKNGRQKKGGKAGKGNKGKKGNRAK